MSDLEWAVQWEVGTPAPELLAATPVAPMLHLPAEDAQLTAEQLDENALMLATFNESVSAHAALIDTDLANPSRWQEVRSIAGDETEARRVLADLRRVHAVNPLTRNFQLATSPPREWTVTE
ncbi:hypothetical protein ACFWE3_10785 [Mycobacteriaceae bacterium NPDC060252]